MQIIYNQARIIKVPRIVNHLVNGDNERFSVFINPGLLVSLPGQSVIDVSANQPASRASKSEPDKLWNADPYGLIHDLADIIHYSVVMGFAAIVGFLASWRKPQKIC